MDRHDTLLTWPTPKNKFLSKFSISFKILNFLGQARWVARLGPHPIKFAQPNQPNQNFLKLIRKNTFFTIFYWPAWDTLKFLLLFQKVNISSLFKGQLTPLNFFMFTLKQIFMVFYACARELKLFVLKRLSYFYVDRQTF